MNKTLKWAITLLIAATLFRTQTLFFLPTLELFGGAAPNGWLGPWVSDAIIGLLVLPMLFLFWTQRSQLVWGVLVVYNAIGAFDYSQGLITQFVTPMPEDMASAATVYGGIGLFMTLQIIALGLLFRQTVIAYFNE
ncbi:MAG: hypothetical protein AAF719_10405 [Pseudomonadota bacterium]